MNCCDYQCDEGRNCPIRTTLVKADNNEDVIKANVWEVIYSYVIGTFTLIGATVALGTIAAFIYGLFL